VRAGTLALTANSSGFLTRTVEGQLGIQCRVDRKCGRHDQQRVAIRRGLGHGIGSNHRARAGAVLDDDRLPERFLQVRLQQPRQDVLCRAGLRRHDDADRPAGISIGPAIRSADKQEKRGGHTDAASLQRAKAEGEIRTSAELHCERSLVFFQKIPRTRTARKH
jgi:hypothetical protein